MPRVKTIEDAIEVQVNLGHKDPQEIAKKVRSSYGDEWLQTQLVERSEEIVARLAQLRLGTRRRGAELALREAQPSRWTKAGGDLKLESKWVPNVGWKRAADLTADDCEAIARHYGSLAIAAIWRREWFTECARQIRKQRVKTLGQLKDLPELPEAAA